MNNQRSLTEWHLLADRFIWYDSSALSLIAEEDIQQYIYTFHGETIPIREIREWRGKQVQDQESTP
jgi:hypothetical protein